MTINFITGDKLVVKQQYVKNTLASLPRTSGLVRTIQTLEYFNTVPAEVVEVGNALIYEANRRVNSSYIKLLPTNRTNINYKRGQGVTIYFESDTYLNNAFEFSTAYLCDTCSSRGLNTSGVAIPKLSVVRYTGFDATTQISTIALADATSVATGKVMGIAEEAIAAGAVGSIIIEGAISGLDTSGYTINGTVFLSDTPGEISDSAGTVTSVVGRAYTVGDPGSISVRGELPFSGSDGGGGGGGGGGFFTDGVGTNAVIGKGDTTPTSGGENSMAQGDNVSISADVNNSFALGKDIDLTSTSPGSSIEGVFASGNSITSASYNGCFLQGKYIEMTSGDNYANFVQGTVIDIENGGSFNFLQGGVFLTMDLGDGRANLVQGRDHTIDANGDTIENNLIQGEDHSIDDGLYNSFMQGENHNFSGPIRRSFAQGEDHSFGTGASNSFAQGYDHNIDASGSFAQGRDNNISLLAAYSFAQGYNNEAQGARSFAQGQYASAYRDDQKSWGSNRSGAPGYAQCSKIIKYVLTTDATPTTLLTFNTEDNKAYSIRANVVGRSETVGTENTSFILEQAIASNNEGTVVLTGSPISFTKAQNVNVLWTVDLASSGTDLLLRVTGAGANTIRWCCSFEFVEVFAED